MCALQAFDGDLESWTATTSSQNKVSPFFLAFDVWAGSVTGVQHLPLPVLLGLTVLVPAASRAGAQEGRRWGQRADWGRPMWTEEHHTALFSS